MKKSYQLKQVADKLWVVDFDAYAKGLHLRLRMTIVLLPGGLWLHSPVAIDDALAAQLSAIGEVRYIVAPNLNHHFFVKSVKERYPGAQVWGVKGFLSQRLGVPVEREMEDGEPFGDDIKAIQIQGIPFSNEVVFYHAPSRTMICTDLVQNIHQEDHFLTRQLWRMIGSWKRLGQNRYWRFQTKDRAASKGSLDKIIAWDAQRLIMSHGDIIETDGASALRQSIEWLGASPGSGVA